MVFRCRMELQRQRESRFFLEKERRMMELLADFDWNQVLRSALIGGVIGGFVGVFVYFFKKKDPKE